MILLYEKCIIYNGIYFWIVYSLLLVFVAFHAPIPIAFVVEAICSWATSSCSSFSEELAVLVCFAKKIGNHVVRFLK